MEIKSEREIREKRDEATRRYAAEEHGPDKRYFDEVYLILDWVLGEGDDPFMDY